MHALEIISNKYCSILPVAQMLSHLLAWRYRKLSFMICLNFLINKVQEYPREKISVFGPLGFWYLLFAKEIKYVYLQSKCFVLKRQNELSWVSTYLSEKCFLFALFDYFLDDLKGFSSVSNEVYYYSIHLFSNLFCGPTFLYAYCIEIYCVERYPYFIHLFPSHK